MTEVTTQNFFQTLAPVSYTLKSGKQKTAHNEISQALMPAAIRKAQASSQALESLKRGIYTPTLQSIKALLTKSDIKALAALGIMPSERPSEKEVCHFFQSVAHLWKDAKGEKVAQATVLKDYLTWVEAKPVQQAEAAIADIS